MAWFTGILGGKKAQSTAERVEPTLDYPQAATALPLAPLPAPPKKQTSIPSYKDRIERSSDLIAKTNRVTANTDATTFRTSTDLSDLIRNFLAGNPDLSATVNAYLRVGIPEKYRMVARDMTTQQVDPEATKVAHQLLTRMTYVGDATLGYNPTTDLQSLSESLGRELLLDGGMSGELVLDQLRLPTYIEPVAVSTLRFREDNKKGKYPVQVIAGEEIDLDIPNFFYVSADQDLLSAYPMSYMNAAIKAVLADEEFNNFLRRQLKRNIAPRAIATIVEEKVKSSITSEVVNDPEQLRDYMTRLVTGVAEMLDALEPEEALVSTDMVTYKMEAPGGGGNIAALVETVHQILRDRVTASTKSLPAVLGQESSAGAATTSTMLFLKNANIIRTKLNVFYSRMFTMALRLLGYDCAVEFVYEELDLRPKAEQEAYKQMEQARVLGLLSLGFITDEDACTQLTGKVLPDGFTPLSGTRFSVAAPAANNTPSQTSNMNGQPDNLKSDAPESGKSPQGQKK